MALTGTLIRRDRLGRGLRAEVLIVASGSYTTGGDTLDLVAVVGMVAPGRFPTFVKIEGKAGYVYQWVGNGTAANRVTANQKMMVRVNTGAHFAYTVTR